MLERARGPRLDGRRFLLGMAAFLALPLAEVPGKAIDVREFGAKGDGVADDAPALYRAVAEAVRLGPGVTVLIPRGRHLLENAAGTHLDVRDARGLTIVGEPGTVLVAWDPDDHTVRLSNCADTAIKQLVLEQEKTYFTQGTIDAMAPDGKSCEVIIGPCYDEPDEAHLAPMRTLRSFSYPDTTAYRQDRWWPTVKSRSRVGDRRWHFEIEGWAVVGDMVKKPFIVRDDSHGSHGVCVDRCRDCTIEDVSYYGQGTNAGLFIANCPGDVTMRRFQILTPPGSDALLSCSGGGQMIDCRGALTWEGCRFDKVDDDGGDVFTGYNRVLQQIDPRTLLIQGHRDYEAPDKVGSSTGRPGSTATRRPSSRPPARPTATPGSSSIGMSPSCAPARGAARIGSGRRTTASTAWWITTSPARRSSSEAAGSSRSAPGAST